MASNGVFEYETLLPQRDVAEHEVFLSFVSDGQALSFMDWMFQTGEKLFLAFLEEHADDY